MENIVVEFLKLHIGYCEQEVYDPYETNDNRAHLVSALYRTLEYCTTIEEYKSFVEDRKNARNSV